MAGFTKTIAKKSAIGESEKLTRRNSQELEGVSRKEKDIKFASSGRCYKSMAETGQRLRQSLLRLVNPLDYHGSSQ